MINLNGVLINMNEVRSVSRHYQITADPGLPWEYGAPRLHITFLSGDKEAIFFDTDKAVDMAFNKLENL